MATGGNMTGRPGVADLRVGDVVRLKKAHPCGGFHWLVNRVGGDIGLRCQTCGHYVMMPRFRIDRRIREIARAAADGESDTGVEPVADGEGGMGGGQSEATGEFNAKAQRRRGAKSGNSDD